MKIVEPSVTLEAITQLCRATASSASNQAAVIEKAGRTCYKSEGKITPDSAGRFVKALIDRGHASVIEHCSATFRIVCDRGISHQIVRHRLASYSQESTRYCNYSSEKFGGDIQVIAPEGLSDKSYLLWEEAMMQAEKFYFYLIDTGCTPEQARDVLPTCLKTEIVVTMNFRSWVHFIKERSFLNSHAHPKMQIIADMVKTCLEEKCPEVFNASAYANLT